MCRLVLHDELVEPGKEVPRVQFEKSFSHYKIIHGEGNDQMMAYFTDDTCDRCDLLSVERSQWECLKVRLMP
ncbi:hypothetical protein APSETT445_002932 [Aspergillus pseudonomiae]